tara:strand:+ start:1736 stop:2467 length:732 start_codon:yes stop_codon:yes gene_type:complete
MNSIFSEIFRISSLNKFEFKKINDREISFLNDQQINQIRIFGTIINLTTIISEKETVEKTNKIYNRIIIDDGSGSISLKSWIDKPINDQTSSINNNLYLTLKKLKRGDVIEALGYLRIYNDEIYLSITNIAIHNDLEWEINRRLDLLKKDLEEKNLNSKPKLRIINISNTNQITSIELQNNQITKETIGEKILKIMKPKTNLFSIEDFKNKLNYTNEEIKQAILYLRTESLIFERKPGKYQKI